jgi:hypothetical protein
MVQARISDFGTGNNQNFAQKSKINNSSFFISGPLSTALSC